VERIKRLQIFPSVGGRRLEKETQNAQGSPKLTAGAKIGGWDVEKKIQGACGEMSLNKGEKRENMAMEKIHE